MQGLPMYTLIDFLDEEVKGYFYPSELQKVTQDENKLFTIEKIIKRRRRQGVKECFVSWDGWGSKYNSWIKESDITDQTK